MKIYNYNKLFWAFLIAVFSIIIYFIKSKNSEPNNYIAAVAGKSGGHIIPCISLAKENLKDNKLIFFSTDSDLDKKIIINSPEVSGYIPLKLDNFPRSKIWLYPKFIFNFLKAICISFNNLYKYNPKKIVSTGGYISMPVLFSAYILRIPIEIFELNAVPGQATKIMSFFASKIFVCFDNAKKYFNSSKVLFKEYPLKYSANNISKSQASKELALNPNKKTLLILGGSQGSHFINNLMQDLIYYTKDQNIKFTTQIIHQTGSLEEANKLRDFYLENNIDAIVFDFTNNLENYYQAADICITRAGSGSLHELKHFNKNGLIIPLETKITDHQVDNAKEWVNKYPNKYKMILQKDILNNYDTLLEEIL